VVKRRIALACAAGLVVLAPSMMPPAADAQTPAAPFGGIWTLNRQLSEFPKEVAFDVDLSGFAEAGQPGAVPQGQGRGGRRSGNTRSSTGQRNPRLESYEDGQRRRILVDEVRTPWTRMTIVDTPTAITITNELGQSRTLHPTGQPDSIEVESIPIAVTTTRDGNRLVVVYHVEQDRDVHWTYTLSGTPARLSAEAQLFDRDKGGDKATRVYEPGLAAATPGPPSTQASSGQQPGAPATPARESFDQRPGAEFAGLKTVGILVEDFGPEAKACGLRQDAIEDALAKKLTAGGLNVRRNSDEDTYVYVNISTTTVANGNCVTRYDAFLYTHATAKLSYRERPVLVQVSLMHRGGIGLSSMAAHSASVQRGLEGYVDLFVSQIRDANK
jgi:hypothetical protein